MEPIVLKEAMLELMSAHGLDCELHDEWVVPNGVLPAIRATWFPQENNGLLSVDALLGDNRLINECFAGLGSGEDAVADAINNFVVNSLHVLLAALWDKKEDEQVTVEEWKIGNESYSAFIGGFGTRGSNENEIQIPDNLFEVIEGVVKSERPSEAISWFRFYFGNVSGEQTFEALNNNEIWDEGLKALESVAWPQSDGFYSVRNFMILKRKYHG